MRLATADDVPALLVMMQEFYTLERLDFDLERQRSVLTTLLSNPDHGYVILIEMEGAIAGYLALTIGFSLEFHGRNGLLDEFYVVPAYQRRGLGRAAIEFAVALLKAQGIAALRLEVDYLNVAARELYLRQGFRHHDRHLMTKWL
jgi:ribosomal protein S18 acetylase RimI-like enzyme